MHERARGRPRRIHRSHRRAKAPPKKKFGPTSFPEKPVERNQAAAPSRKAPALIYHDLNLVERILRDQVSDDFTAIWMDNEAGIRAVLRLSAASSLRWSAASSSTPRKRRSSKSSAFSTSSTRRCGPKVWLKSGGYIVINQTEALVAIDVNTGKFVGKADAPGRHHRQDQPRRH